MKKILFIIGIFLAMVIIGFFIGRSFFKPAVDNSNIISKKENNLKKNNFINVEKNEKIAVNTSEEKISVNTIIKKVTYYSNCNHNIELIIKDKKKYINMTKEMLQKEFPDWEIKEFNRDNVILYKEEDDFCNEHFLVKDEDGYVTVYTIDNNENILELLDKTNISTKYLARY